MSKRINILILSMIFLFAIMPFASAVSNLDIPLPTALGDSYGTFKLGSNISLIQTCTNETTFCDECNFTSLVFDGETLIANVEMTKSLSLFNYTLDGSLTNNVGKYTVTGFCIGGNIYSPFAYNFEVNRTGQPISPEMVYIYIALLFLLITFLTLSILGFANFDNLLARVGLFGFAYLLLIAITFIGWNMANDFIITNSFIIDFMRILFFVLVIGAFPLLIGAFAYYIIMLFKIKEIERLMTKGISRDEAEKRQGRKYKR